MDAIVIGGGTTILTAGAQGPAGPIGLPGAEGQPGNGAAPSISVLNASGVTLYRGMPVFMETDGSISKADAMSKVRMVGLVATDVLPHNTYGLVQVDGMMDATVLEWEVVTNSVGGIVVGAQYFLSDVPGRITMTPNPAGAVAKVGRAVSALRFIIDIEPPIYT